MSEGEPDDPRELDEATKRRGVGFALLGILAALLGVAVALWVTLGDRTAT